jgi:bis(5'-nucleosyl)-tetraphosphatase (symmetrical)
MAVYAIGDIQGCYTEFRTLLDKLHFEPSSDQLWLTGDLVNRGPESLATLRFVRSLGHSAVTVLGNHDLHLLALYFAADPPVVKHNLGPILAAADANELLEWLRRQPLAHYDAAIDTLMVHAGIAPEWDGLTTLQLAAEVETALRGNDPGVFLQTMYGNEPALWRPSLAGDQRLRCITNYLTRVRLVAANGAMDFAYKGPLSAAPAGLVPWFDHPARASGSQRIVCGHWSALGLLTRENLLALDTGCVWGGALTAVQLDIPGAEAIATPSLQPKVF